MDSRPSGADLSCVFRLQSKELPPHSNRTTWSTDGGAIRCVHRHVRNNIRDGLLVLAWICHHMEGQDGYDGKKLLKVRLQTDKILDAIEYDVEENGEVNTYRGEPWTFAPTDEARDRRRKAMDECDELRRRYIRSIRSVAVAYHYSTCIPP